MSLLFTKGREEIYNKKVRLFAPKYDIKLFYLKHITESLTNSITAYLIFAKVQASNVGASFT